MITLLPFLLHACVHAPYAGPPRGGAAAYDVAVVVASGDRTVTSLYGLDVEHTHDQVWTFTTTWSEGTWEEPGQVLAFDSRHPRASDPWPLVMQHAVSQVPTALLMVDGSPSALADEQGWQRAGQVAIHAVDLPVQALSTGQMLLQDPGGVVRDLQRNFPGTPPEGEWRRVESIAGLPATRVEVCGSSGARGEVRWVCLGEIEGPTTGPARLHDVTSKTILVTDKAGVVSMETVWAGTMVLLDPDQERVVDRPVAGQRLVRRR